MKIITKKTLDVTPPLEEYIDAKLLPLGKFLKHFEGQNEAELWLEVSRTTKHHQKGEELFKAVIDLKLPGKTLRSEASANDIRTAIDDARNIMHMEIEKYREKHLGTQKHLKKEK